MVIVRNYTNWLKWSVKMTFRMAGAVPSAVFNGNNFDDRFGRGAVVGSTGS